MSRQRSSKSSRKSRTSTARQAASGRSRGAARPQNYSPLGPCPFCEAERTGKPLPPARVETDGLLVRAVGAHVEEHIGPVCGSVYQMKPGPVDITILYVEPTPDRPWHTFVTAGMAKEAMKVPSCSRVSPHAELMLCLPGRWPADTILSNPRRSWPLTKLRDLAEHPHETGRYLAWGHTMSDADRRIYSRGSKLCALFLRHPVLVPDEFRFLEVGDGREVEFFGVVPITSTELDLKLGSKCGAVNLDRMLRMAGVTELCEPRRADVTQTLLDSVPRA